MARYSIVRLCTIGYAGKVPQRLLPGNEVPKGRSYRHETFNIHESGSIFLEFGLKNVQHDSPRCSSNLERSTILNEL